MAETNFKVFNEEMSEDKTYSDSEYEVATQRQTGVIPGMALSRLHNKMYRQISAMVKGIADFLVKEGFDAKDNDIPGITQSIKKAIKKIAGDDITGHNTNTTAHADIRTKITNDITDHNTDATAHANGIAGNAATATRLKAALSGSRNQCWLLCKLPKNSYALVHYKILGAQYYDQYSVLEVAIKNGAGWCKYTGFSANYQVSVKAYETDNSIDVYLFAQNYDDIWEVFLKKNNAVTEFAYKKMGDATYVPAGMLVCDTSSGRGMGGVELFRGKRIATIDDVNAVGLNLLKRNTAYAVGDIAYSNLLPSWARLECVKAGTTASTDIAIPNTVQAGILITDSTVMWIIDDVRDCTAVGDTVGKLYLPDGYVKANGATVLRADYPRLVNLADKYSLWTTDVVTYPSMFGEGDGSTTMLLPDWRGVVMRHVDDGKGYDTNRILGTYQEDAIRNITGTVTCNGGGSFASGNGIISVSDRGANIAPGPAQSTHYDDFIINASKQVPTAAENRVKNIALIPCIKY